MAEDLERSLSFSDGRASVSMATESERARWPPLTRLLMSGEMSGEPPREFTLKERFDVWMVNEGYRRLFVVVFVLVHLMIFAFAFLNFDLKDNLTTARTTFGMTFVIARSAALVLHFDVALLILRTYLHIFFLTHVDDPSCVPHTHLTGETNASQWHYTIW